MYTYIPSIKYFSVTDNSGKEMISQYNVTYNIRLDIITYYNMK